MYNIFISIYRFDEEYLNFINKKYASTNNTFVSLFELKNNGMQNLIKTFISYRKYDDVIIVFNDVNYKVLESLFYVLSLTIPKFKIFKILPNKRIEKVSLFDRFGAVFKIGFSAIETKILVRKVRHDIKLISDKNRHILNNVSRVFYLKTNLSFGMKAGGSLGHISGVVNSLSKKSKVIYISAEIPVIIDKNIERNFVSLDSVIYSVPYELNSLKINKEFIRQIDILVNTKKPSIIYQRLTLFNYSGAYLSNKYKIPLIVEYNGSEVWVQNNWGTSELNYSTLALEIEEYVLNSADTVITVSKVLKDELIERGFDEDKIVFYPNCIDEKVFDYKLYKNENKRLLREKLGFKESDKIFTFIGTFGAWHGVEFLATAIVKLVKNYKKELDIYNIKFLLIGDGLLGEKVRKTLGTDYIKNYVKFTGIIPQNEAPEYLSISDGFLSPHIKQKGKFIGSPTKLFEYMAFARPIIASNLDQIGEIFECKLYANNLDNFKTIINESAIVYEPNNYDEFVKSILFVSRNGGIDKLGQNAYDMVMDRYTWNIHIYKIIEKYNEINHDKKI